MPLLIRFSAAAALAYAAYAICRAPVLPLFARELGAGPELIGLVARDDPAVALAHGHSGRGQHSPRVVANDAGQSNGPAGRCISGSDDGQDEAENQNHCHVRAAPGLYIAICHDWYNTGARVLFPAGNP